MPPIFLELHEILEIHQDQLDRYGGSAGIHDLGLLQSALAQPLAQFDGSFLHTDLYEMAAAYLFHIVANHPFVDGNKRVGLVAALVFLELNEFEIDAPDEELESLVWKIAAGELQKTAIASFLRTYGHKATP